MVFKSLCFCDFYFFVNIFCYLLGSLCSFIAFCVYLLMFSVSLLNILGFLVILHLFVAFLWTVVVLCMWLYFLFVVSCSCYCSWSLWLFNATLKSCFSFVVIHLHFAFFPHFLYLWSCSALIFVDLCECGDSCLYFCGSSSTAQPHCPIRNLHENQVNSLAFLHFELCDWTSSSLTF